MNLTTNRAPRNERVGDGPELAGAGGRWRTATFESDTALSIRAVGVGTAVAKERRMASPQSIRQSSALTVTLNGLEASLVRVEVDCARGLPGFHIVGLPEASVRESRTRVRAALRHLGVELNEHAITVNLAPADVRKSGSGFDLAVASAILCALGLIPPDSTGDAVLLGELSMSGEVQPVRGVLPALLGARVYGKHHAIVPHANAAEARGLESFRVQVARTIMEVVEYFRGGSLPNAADVPLEERTLFDCTSDLAEVRGQDGARRALEIAAAGHHNLLFVGPPGTGKTMLARRLPSLLPLMTEAEALEVTAIHSVAGLLPASHGLVRERPFRAPHHTISSAALLGGGSFIRPGEISLSHHGCLFLDELLEFGRHVIDGMRQPLEEGRVTIARSRHSATFPARSLLIAAVNPCPCGYYGSKGPKSCRCGYERVERYRSRLSGPILDRIDLHVGLAPVSLDELAGARASESSSVVRDRVHAARSVQRARLERGETTSATNSELGPAELDRVAPLCARSRLLFERAMSSLGLSARGFVRLRRVARTIADLAGSDAVRAEHIAEAIASRSLDREATPMRSAS